MEEINDWIPVKGYEGLYEVSGILGKVRSLNYRGHRGVVRILKGGPITDGYIGINLSKNGKTKPFREHRIVAEHFCPNPLNLPEVNHLNEKTDDNRASNLSWVTHKENINYGTRNERVAEAHRGIYNTKTSKPVLQFTKTGEFVQEWPSISEAERNGFDSGHVSACCRGKLKSHKGFKWRYK